MDNIIFGILAFGYLPVAICLWIGVTAIHKTGTVHSRSCLRIGAIFFAIGTVGISLAMIAMESGRSGFRIPPLIIEYAFVIHAVGLFLFAIGFALHCHRSGRAVERITELEMMNLAQATELERLRNR